LAGDPPVAGQPVSGVGLGARAVHAAASAIREAMRRRIGVLQEGMDVSGICERDAEGASDRRAVSGLLPREDSSCGG
jgi:hypothetical protein